MEFFEHDTLIGGRVNSYKCNYLHMYLKGESPLTNYGFKEVSQRDYASFIHEFVHYIQQITTPYGIKYNNFFNNRLIIYREFISSSDTVVLPIKLQEVIEPSIQLERKLESRNGSLNFSKGNIDEIEIEESEVISAENENRAVRIPVYDFENDRIIEDGFQFGYWCIVESMAHLVQSLINPELFHPTVPYKSAELICSKVRPELKGNTKLLISICYIALFFDNPGSAFFAILNSVKKNEDGITLFQRYMRDYSRSYLGETMPNYRMMHIMMNDIVKSLETLVGTDLIYYKEVFKNCKAEASSGDSVLLNILYSKDLNDTETLTHLIDFYGKPAIDSINDDIVVPFNPETNRPYLENASLISLELMVSRFENKTNQTLCDRYQICDRDKSDNSAIETSCSNKQWEKTKPCLFKNGLMYWRWDNKKFEQKPNA